MALNLLLSGQETTDRKEIILTDVTENWGQDGNIDFNAVLYAELRVGIRGVLYGPVIITDVFAAATTTADLVYTLTPELLGLDDELFDDAVHEYHYGVSDLANPPIIDKDVWPLDTMYNFPLGSTTNKLPFNVTASTTAIRYELKVSMLLNTNDEAVSPNIFLSVNYQDGTKDTQTVVVPKDGISANYTLTIETDKSKEIESVTGYILNESRATTSGRSGEITSIILNEGFYDLVSNVLRGLASEKTKAELDRQFIAFQRDFLCGKQQFDKHERLIVYDMAFNSVTNAAKEGLSENAEAIIDFLNEGI